jgi:hypothetical protein
VKIMKKVIVAAFAVALLVGGFAVVAHQQKAQTVASVIAPQLDPGGGGRYI